MGANPFEQDLARCAANYAPLTPVSFLDRTAAIWPDHPSIVHGELRYTWAETAARCRRLASALVRAGIRAGDTVATSCGRGDAARPALRGL